MFCKSIDNERERSSKEGGGGDTEEIDKTIFRFGETLIKLVKSAKETLRNEILFCRKGETGMTGVPWQKIMTGTSSTWLQQTPFYRTLIAMFFSHDHHLHNLRRPTSRRCMKLIRVVDAFYSV